MTYDLRIIDRAALGLKPLDEMTAADWTAVWQRAADDYNAFEVTGFWSCGLGWVDTILAFCAPILDHGMSDIYVLSTLYGAAEERALRAESPHYPKIPARKFGSTDPWYFTPRECRILAYHLHNAPDPDLRHLGRFFALARQHGGCHAA